MRFDIWKTQREKAEIEPETGLKILREGPSQTGKFFAMIWNPKATKPYANYSFKREESREEYIAKQIEFQKQHVERKEKAKIERNGTPEDMAKVQIGDIFCNSWGWEQTNVDYYQVVAKSNRTVTVREIGCKSVPGSGVSHGMADNVIPTKDKFLEKSEPLKKTVYFYNGTPSLPMKHGYCGKVREGEQHYRSWYA